MTAPLGGYTFLPWLRNGVANMIATADGDPSVKVRATIDVQLDIDGERADGSHFTSPLNRAVPLVGPGDILGVDPRAIVRTDPRAWITNFESEYLAAIEFYDEDFPWRYTPAAPDAARHRLRPWLALVVLTEDEFVDVAPTPSRPLAAIKVSNAALFQPADELWAWAHVHVMRPLIPGTVVPPDLSAVLGALGTTLNENADLACSRILSPRRLEPDTAYHAFLIPAFERGRLAGLGDDPDTAPHATVGAWDVYTGRPDPDIYPCYYRWFFRTGDIGDFEYLVRLLQPRPVDSRVGTRDIDVLDPGENLPPIDDPALAGVLKLGGALRVPRADLTPDELAIADKYENWAQPYPRPFQEKLAAFVNLADTYNAVAVDTANLDAGFVEDGDGDPDPLVTAPLYGRWHAETNRLLTNRDGTPVPNRENWVHELNLDPRHRVAAGFGTDVIQAGQEDFMQAAWEQIGDVLNANRALRWGQLALAASSRLYTQQIQPLMRVSADSALALTAPLHARVLSQGTTIFQTTRQSILPRAALSAPLRRVVRPNARLATSLPFTAANPPAAVASRIVAGKATATPPKTTPDGVVTLNEVADAVETATVSSFIDALLKAIPMLPTLVVVVALIIAAILWTTLGAIGLLLGVVVAAIGFWLRALLAPYAAARAVARSIAEANQTVDAVDAMPPAPTFTIDPAAPPATTSGGVDSPDAVRFKQAMRDSASITALSESISVEPQRTTLNVVATATATVVALDPVVTIPTRLWRVIKLPSRMAGQAVGSLREVMYYPIIDTPMFRPLTNISSELFLPNLNLIPPNSITLLETNQKFIEAYMVGLNHEFSRELLWREYPTDQRGSYFRQFWDVSSYVDTQNRSPEQLREDLRDIPPIHTWAPTSQLGEHDNRAQERGAAGSDVVLVIRGELLKRYPTAVIYAHRADWPRIGNVPGGPIDHTKQRELVEILPAEANNPPATKIRLPLYEAKVDPDIYFFGFDLTVDAVIGGTGDHDTDDPGWFFVIKERPGEPRFGFDDGPASTPQSDTPQVWNDLTWGDAGTAPGGLVHVAALPSLTLKPIPSSSTDDDKKAQRAEDVAVPFNASTNAADLAYVMFQAPVLVAVHAAEMLRQR